MTYSNIKHFTYGSQFVTLGSNQAFGPRTNQRGPFQLQPRHGHANYTLDNFGGATPPPDSLLYPCIRSEGSICLYLQRGRHSKRDPLLRREIGRRLATADQRDG